MAETSQITIVVDKHVLQDFRAECTRRDTTPTKAVADFIQHQLMLWERETHGQLTEKLAGT